MTTFAPLPPSDEKRPFAARRALWLVPLLGAFAACADLDTLPVETPEAIPPMPAVAARGGAPRLSAAQYRNAVRDIFGHDIAVPTAIEPDTSLDGFVSIGSAQSAISPRGIEQYEDAAFKIAEQALATEAKRATLVPCSPAGPADDACARQFIESLGRKVWRRPLTGEEVAKLAGVITLAGTTLSDFYEGAKFGIAALLQAPSFLYRAVLGEADPDAPGSLRATHYELATRLSFFLWNSTPDEELLDAADQGDLGSQEVIKAQADRMLNDPRARQGLRNFVTENLRLDQLDTLSKDPTLFTTYSPDLGPAAREETLLDFEHWTFDKEGDYRELFTTRHTFVNPKLASMYQVAAPLSDGFAEVELPSDLPRAGLLGHISFLSLYAHPTSSSATLRGKLVRTVLLCGLIPPPPADVNTALPEPSPDAATLRERVKIHLLDPFCANCHLHMDPIGLGLENFDGIGRYRAKDNGAVIDATGDLDGAPFTGPLDLGLRVKEHPDLGPCLTRRMYGYATSFAVKAPEEDVIAALAARFAASGYKVKTLMFDIATSPGFRLVGEAQ